MVDEEEDIARGNEKGAERRERGVGMDEGGGGGEKMCRLCFTFYLQSPHREHLALVSRVSSLNFFLPFSLPFE